MFYIERHDGGADSRWKPTPAGGARGYPSASDALADRDRLNAAAEKQGRADRYRVRVGDLGYEVASTEKTSAHGEG